MHYTMKFTLIALIAGLCAFAVATPIAEEQGIQGGYHQYKLSDNSYLQLYKNVLRLFKYVHQPTYYKDHVDMAKNWEIESHFYSYTKSEVVKEFLCYYHKGMLPRDEIFSIFYDYHRKQAIALFNIFYYAKDFETFYNTAVWARSNLNQGMFLYSFSVALIHRPDTRNMVLPPIYEIYPYYFFNTEVIQKAQYYKQMWSNTGTMQEQEHLIYSNYSGWYMNLHPEQSMSYFTEDIGVNSYYYYYNLYRPFWMNGEEYHLMSYNRGEEFYYFYQQLLARYYLERLSNDMGEIGVYDYGDAFETGYYPSLCYPNGMEFPERPNWAYFFTNYYNHKQSTSFKGKYPYSYHLVKDYERRIRDAIDAGFIYTEDDQKINLMEPHGFNLLGNMIESNPHSPNTRFYGYLQVFARHLLGYSFQPLHEYKLAPSALEHFETSLRDPAFWMFFKRMILYFQKYKYYLPQYTYDELKYHGVKIESVEVERLLTYFDYYDSDVTNAVYMNQKEFEHNNFEVRVRQWRLNHKPFTYKINLISDKVGEAVVRVFIGPKYDEYGRFIHMDENRMNFVEFDRFKYELKAGKNMIERNSQKIFYASDRTSYKQLYRWVMSGMTEDDFMMHGSEIYYAFPNRFLLPKGKHGGQTYQFYVIVSPYKAHTMMEPTMQHQQYNQMQQLHGQEYDYFKYPMVGLGIQYLDDYPLGYPFDRPINEQFFYVPNAYFQDVIIYHKQMDHMDNYLLHHNKMGMENMQGMEMQSMGSMYSKDMRNMDMQRMGPMYGKGMHNMDMQRMGPMYGKGMHNMDMQRMGPMYGKGMHNMDMEGTGSMYGKGMHNMDMQRMGPMYGKGMHNMDMEGTGSMYGKGMRKIDMQRMGPMYGKGMHNMDMEGTGSMYGKGMHNMDMQSMGSMYGEGTHNMDMQGSMYGKGMHNTDMEGTGFMYGKGMHNMDMNGTGSMYGKGIHNMDMKGTGSMYGKGMHNMDMEGTGSMYGKGMHNMDMEGTGSMYGKGMHNMDVQGTGSMYGKGMHSMDMEGTGSMYGKGMHNMDMEGTGSMYGKGMHNMDMEGTGSMYGKGMHNMDMEGTGSMYGKGMYNMDMKGTGSMYGKGMHNMDMEGTGSMYGKGMHNMDMEGTGSMYGKVMHNMDMKGTGSMYGKGMHNMDMQSMGSMYGKSMDNMDMQGMGSMYGKGMHGMDSMQDKGMHGMNSMHDKGMHNMDKEVMDSSYSKNMHAMNMQDMDNTHATY